VSEREASGRSNSAESIAQCTKSALCNVVLNATGFGRPCQRPSPVTTTTTTKYQHRLTQLVERLADALALFRSCTTGHTSPVTDTFHKFSNSFKPMPIAT
jgi:hypothetical protein